jgi:hypothetical protein
MLNHTHVASRPPTDQASIAAILAADRADIFQETTLVQASRRDAPVICANCGRKVLRRMRGQRFCSARCRDRGRGRSRKAFLGNDTRAPTTPTKKRLKFNGLHPTKTASNTDICGPARVIEAECFAGRSWQWATPAEDLGLRNPCR